MQSLLAIEWLKIRKYRTFWILIIMFGLLLWLWNYGISRGFLQMGGKGAMNPFAQSYSFSSVWENLGFWAGFFVVFLAVLVVILTTNEYQYRTNRQNVIDGWDRLQFYHAKCVVTLSLAIFTTVYVFLLGTGFGFSNSGASSFPGNISKLFYVFVIALNYYGFAQLLSLLFKRSGITIGIFFLYSMILESILNKFINWKFDTHIADFLPLQCSDELLPFPLLKVVGGMMGAKPGPTESSYLIASFMWIAVYYIVGRVKLLKSDW